MAPKRSKTATKALRVLNFAFQSFISLRSLVNLRLYAKVMVILLRHFQRGNNAYHCMANTCLMASKLIADRFSYITGDAFHNCPFIILMARAMLHFVSNVQRIIRLLLL